MQLTTPEVELLNQRAREGLGHCLMTRFIDVYIFGRTYVVDYCIKDVRYYSTLVIRGNYHPERFLKYWGDRQTEIEGVRYAAPTPETPCIEHFSREERVRLDDRFNLPGNFKTIVGWTFGSHYLIIGEHQGRLTQVMFPRNTKMSVEEGLSLSLEIGNYIRVEEVTDYDTEAALDIDGYRIIGAPDRH